MKMQDFLCPECGFETEALVRPGEEHRVCFQCMVFMTPIQKATATPIPDDVPGGFWIENLAPEPLYFERKSDWRRKTKELGMENMVRHRGEKGSDKSKYTSRWV